MMKLFIFLLFLIVPRIFVAGHESHRITRQADESVPSDKKISDDEKSKIPADIGKKPFAQSPVKNGSVDTKVTDKISNITSTGNVKINPPATTIEIPIGPHTSSINSGALMRGIFVMLGLSVIVMAYMVFRSLRVNKSRPQMVRKYGILAHRQDVEMRPLPLEEDDEDDTTVFDASSIMKNGS